MQERSEAERRAIWPCLNVATWRPSHTKNMIKLDRIPFDPCNSIKRFDLCPFDQKKSTYLQPALKTDSKYKTCLGYVPISSSAPRPLETAYVPILLSKVVQEQRHSGNRDREAIVVGAGLCNGEGERAYTGYTQHFFLLSKSLFLQL